MENPIWKPLCYVETFTVESGKFEEMEQTNDVNKHVQSFTTIKGM